MNHDAETGVETQPTTEPLVQTDTLVLHKEETTTGTGHMPQVVLKHGDAFLITDTVGDLPTTHKEIGLFWQGTRFCTPVNLCSKEALLFHSHIMFQI